MFMTNFFEMYVFSKNKRLGAKCHRQGTADYGIFGFGIFRGFV